MKRIFTILATTLAIGQVVAQSSLAGQTIANQNEPNAALEAFRHSDEELLNIDGKKSVKVSEFMYIYEKNSQTNNAQAVAVEQKSIDDYMNLFINFKLKVYEAELQGLDTTESFLKELKGYRAQATPKYLQDKEALDSLVRLSYHNMAHMRRAAHITIECRKTANDSAKQIAKARIDSIRQCAMAHPEKFNELAKKHSTDPNAAKNGGELGWIIPFRYVYSFEDAIYNTPVGGITDIFESPYGYHVALVEEETTTEEVQAAHIMKMAKQGDEAQDAKAKNAIDSLYQVLTQTGIDFSELAKAESDDKGSAARGGDLGWFTKGLMVKDFEDKAFGMNKGEISQPFRSVYGWHIIHLLDKRTIQPLDSLHSLIEKNVLRDERAQEVEKAFIRKVRREYQLSQDMSDSEVMNYADEHLEEKYPELQHLVEEYHDGILLFDISLEKVWDKASKDTVGLENYFAQHRKEYTWDTPRYKGYIIYAQNEEVAKRAKTIIKTACPDSINSYINQRINQDSLHLVRIEHGVWKLGKNAAVDKYGFKVKESSYEASEKYPFVMAYGKTIKRPETYLDDRGKITSDYQDQLEKVWIDELKTRHTVTINHDLIQRIKAAMQ